MRFKSILCAFFAVALIAQNPLLRAAEEQPSFGEKKAQELAKIFSKIKHLKFFIPIPSADDVHDCALHWEYFQENVGDEAFIVSFPQTPFKIGNKYGAIYLAADQTGTCYALLTAPLCNDEGSAGEDPEGGKKEEITIKERIVIARSLLEMLLEESDFVLIKKMGYRQNGGYVLDLILQNQADGLEVSLKLIVGVKSIYLFASLFPMGGEQNYDFFVNSFSIISNN